VSFSPIGQGVGEYAWDESRAYTIRRGVDLGLNFIDTAEIYDGGRAERVVGKAVDGIRDSVIIATKFSPQNSSYSSVISSAEDSLRRLNTDYIDLYQVHWPNPQYEADEYLSAMSKLHKDGKIRHCGLGNTSLSDLVYAKRYMEDILVSVQLEYNLFDRSTEQNIIPFCSLNGILLIAYSPLDHGLILDGENRRKKLDDIAFKYNATVSQIALRWLIEKDCVVVIPKASRRDHLRENAASQDINLFDEDIAEIDILSRRTLHFVEPDKISVASGCNVYTSLEEARDNELGFCPSPTCLAESIKKDSHVKPVRLLRDSTGKYSLVEGRIRYWAWVIAMSNKPIPAYFREECFV
jgi:diketogulonate reductase-like aldo/keto reductase